MSAILETGSSAIKELAVAHPVVFLAFIVATLSIALRQVLNRRPKLDFPVVEIGPEGCRQTLIDAFEKYPNEPYILKLKTERPFVVLPGSCVNDLKSLPESEVSFMEDTRRQFLTHVTGIGANIEEIIPAVKNDLTRHITSVLDDLQDETRYALDKEMGPCDDWTPQPLYSKLTRVVALLSGRVFVGKPLSREEFWIDTSISYTFNCVKAQKAMEKIPQFIRSFVAPFLPEVRELKRQRVDGGKALEPVLEDVLSRTEKGKGQGGLHKEAQGQMCSWLLKYAPINRRNAPSLAHNQMNLSFAAIHTTSMALSQVIYDLVDKPQYVEPLREEIEQVIKADGLDVDSDGYPKLKKTSFTKLKKLDSFLKESQRLNPPGLTSMMRVNMVPIKLSTGHTLPPNTRICFPSWAIHTSEKTHSFSPDNNPPGQFTPPFEFDGLRFYKLREMAGNENKYQYVTTSTESLIFGHGIHACPGRFFASNEIKVVLVALLRSWDMRLKGDVEGKGGARPENLMSEYSISPNVNAEVEFRRRAHGI